MAETLEVDVLIVGGGPAGFSAALRLAQLQKASGGESLSVAVLEKARDAGAHSLSGAVLDPSTLRELIPDCEAKGVPFAVPVHRDHVYFLTRQSKLPFPIIPPPLQNHGNVIVSLNALVRWLSEQVEKEEGSEVADEDGHQSDGACAGHDQDVPGNGACNKARRR